jgi:hypothetical protein
VAEDNLDAKLHSTFDSTIWAKEFMRIFETQLLCLDEELMHAWFANAIMCGWDHANQGENRRLKKEDVMQAFGAAYCSKENSGKVVDSSVGIEQARLLFKQPWED